MIVTKQQYDDLLKDRPVKFTPEEVGYTDAGDSAMRCSTCRHYYLRQIDQFAVCEILRSDEIDDEGINPGWRCRFWTIDGERLPLLEGSDRDG